MPTLAEPLPLQTEVVHPFLRHRSLDKASLFPLSPDMKQSKDSVRGMVSVGKRRQVWAVADGKIL
ncbi:MAG: hypothetical protein OHK0029_04990 [Armatimonadaceae bacterium]